MRARALVNTFNRQKRVRVVAGSHVNVVGCFFGGGAGLASGPMYKAQASTSHLRVLVPVASAMSRIADHGVRYFQVF